MSLIKSLTKDVVKLPDETLINNMIVASETGAGAYLAASLKSTTPEIRAMFTANLNQMIGGHTALSELAIQRGWNNPYEAPEHQLLEAFNHSQNVVNIQS